MVGILIDIIYYNYLCLEILYRDTVIIKINEAISYLD